MISTTARAVGFLLFFKSKRTVGPVFLLGIAFTSLSGRIASASTANSYPAGSSDYLGRPSEAEVQAVLDSLAFRSTGAEVHLRQVAETFVKAFELFDKVFSREHGPAMQQIERIRLRLGTELVPSTGDDVEAILNSFGQCLTAARSRSTHDMSGKEVGPGSTSPNYLQIFLSGDAHDTFVKKQTELRTAFRTTEDLEQVRASIILIEVALNHGETSRALSLFDDLRTPGATPYLALIGHFRADLKAVQESQAHSSGDQDFLVGQIKQLSATQSRLEEYAGFPNAIALLQRCFDSQKVAIKLNLQALSALALGTFGGHGVSGRSSPTSPSDSARLSQIQEALSTIKPLDDLLADHKALETVRSVYGQSIYSQLIKEGADIASAKREEEVIEARLDARTQMAQSQPARLRITVLSARQVYVTQTDENGYEQRAPKALERVTVSFAGAGPNNGIAFDNRQFAGDRATADLLCLAACATLHVGDVRFFVTSHYVGRRSVPYLTLPTAYNGMGGWQILELCSGGTRSQCMQVSTINDR